jgi:hypothetical protein
MDLQKHVSHVRMRGADNILVENAASSIVAKAYLPRRCLAIELSVVAGMSLLTRCLAMDINVTISLVHDTHQDAEHKDNSEKD